jgi:hypothetical protein
MAYLQLHGRVIAENPILKVLGFTLIAVNLCTQVAEKRLVFPLT